MKRTLGLFPKVWATAGMLLCPLLASGHSSVTIDGDVFPFPAESPVWDTAGQDLVVGDEGIGAMTISAGASVTNNWGIIGHTSDGEGKVTVTGENSTWTSTDYLIVGRLGTAELTISNGAKVNNITGYVGFDWNSVGTVIVDGRDSTWTNTLSLEVGGRGTGTLTLSNGGKVFNNAGYVGYYSDSIGTVTVTGENSLWANTNSFLLGIYGTGELTVSAGGKVTNTYGYIGNYADSSGAVTVDGQNSTWTNTLNLQLGVSGLGELTISNGGEATNVHGYLGFEENSEGNATVTGAESTWTNSGALRVGNKGKGTLRVEDGGEVTATAISIADGSDSEGDVTISGADSTLSTVAGGSRALYVGNNGTGTLRIENGGRVSNLDGYIGTHHGSIGNATVTGAESLWENGGNLVVNGNSTTNSTTGSGVLTIADGGRVSVAGTTRVHTNGTVNLEVGGTLQTQHLNSTNGTFNFLGGTLIANGTITGDLAVPEFGALAGNATVTGNLLVAGTLAPGNSTGLITVEGNLTLDSTAQTILEIASLTDFDRIAVHGGITFGGTLILNLLAGFTLDDPAEFTLFTGDYAWLAGTFANIEFSNSSYEGIFNHESGTLNITVIPEPSTYALLITISASLFFLRCRNFRAA